jgi:hypothetical protein
MAQVLRKPQAEKDEVFSGKDKDTSIYLYYSNSNTPRYERYEILDPDDADYASEESFAMSANIERALECFNILGVDIKSPSEVLDYLYRYPEIVELAQYAADLVVKHFGRDLKLSLDMYQDPEAPIERLTLYARLSSYDKNTIKIIKQIRNDYYQSFPITKGRFLLTTDFRVLR